jgi:hypothetical protein
MGLLRIGEIRTKPNKLNSYSNGNPYYIFTESTFDDGKVEPGKNYDEITSNKNWMSLGQNYYDYLFCRNQVIMWTATNGWTGLTTEEKQMAAQHFAVGTTERAEVYTDNELQDFWNDFVNKSQECRTNRWKLGKGYISYVLDLSDSLHMAEITNTLSNSYIIYGIESLADDGKVGLFDWVEGTGPYSGGTGFSGESYWTQEYQDNLSSILRKGFK